MDRKDYIGPYKRKKRDNFSLYPFEKAIISEIEEIFRTKTGVFVLCGEHGSGKTTLKNIAMENIDDKNYSNKKIWKIDLDFTIDKIEFQRHILEEINNKCVDGINNNSTNEEKERYKNWQEYAIGLRNNLYETKLKTINSKTYDEIKTKNLGVQGRLGYKNIGGMIEGELGKQNRRIEGKTDEIEKLFFNVEKEKKLIKLITEISKEFHITVIIDELDKKPCEDVIEFINENKNILLNSEIAILLITDTNTAIYLRDYCDYIYSDNIILVPCLDFFDFISRRNEKGFDVPPYLVDMLDDYYISRCNNRESLFNDRKRHRSDSVSKGLEFFGLLNSDFHENLDDLHKEIFVKIYYQTVENLSDDMSMSEEEFTLFLDDFIDKNKITSFRLKNNMRKFQRNLFDEKIIRADQQLYRKTERYGESRVYNNISIYEFLKYLNEYFRKMLMKQKIIVRDNTIYWVGKRLSTFEEDELLKESREKWHMEFTRNDFLNYILKLAKHKVSYRPFYNRKWNYVDKEIEDKLYGVDNAIEKIKQEKVAGIIIFYLPKVNDKILINGLLFIENGFGETEVYPYLGYPGLDSHKPYRIEELRDAAKRENIPYYELDKESSLEIFKCCNGLKEFNDDMNWLIKDVCRKNMQDWLLKLEDIYVEKY